MSANHLLLEEYSLLMSINDAYSRRGNYIDVSDMGRTAFPNAQQRI
jgi:hypothetical protein